MQLNRDFVRASVFSGGAGLFIQLLAAVAGFFVIRNLSIEDYAIYGIIQVFCAGIAVMSDSGIGRATMAHAGKSWPDQLRVDAVLVIGLRLRKRQFIVVASIGIALLGYALWNADCGYLSILILLCLAMLQTWMALGGAIYEIPFKLNQQVGAVSYINALIGLFRAIGQVAASFFVPLITLVCSVNAISAVLQNKLLFGTRWRKGALVNSVPDMAWAREVEKDLAATSRRVAPTAVYSLFSGQIVMWIMVLLGGKTDIASVAALGRLTLLWAPILTIVNSVVIPRFSRLKWDRHKLRLLFLAISTLFLVIPLPLALGIGWKSDQVVGFLFGAQYEGLGSIMTIYLLGSLVSLAGSCLYGLLASRNVIMPPSLSILFSLGLNVFALLVLPVDTLAGAVLITTFVQFPMYLVGVAYGIFNLK